MRPCEAVCLPHPGGTAPFCAAHRRASSRLCMRHTTTRGRGRTGYSASRRIDFASHLHRTYGQKEDPRSARWVGLVPGGPPGVACTDRASASLTYVPAATAMGPQMTEGKRASQQGHILCCLAELPEAGMWGRRCLACRPCRQKQCSLTHGLQGAANIPRLCRSIRKAVRPASLPCWRGEKAMSGAQSV